ncbi:hypothetical protein HY992_03775 [Candidatus Micrarchaeota archaeon]|nr:hypothetical protein [Candidatus Micrarchaeota archaeon]
MKKRRDSEKNGKVEGAIPQIVFFEKKIEKEIKTVEHGLDSSMHHDHFTLRIFSFLVLLLAANMALFYAMRQFDSSTFAAVALLNVALVALGFWLCLLNTLRVAKIVLLASVFAIETVGYFAGIGMQFQRIEALLAGAAVDLLVIAYLMKIKE